MRKVVILVLLIVLHSGFARGDYRPADENLRHREEFQDDKFGLFIHWGLYSILGNGEWIMHDKNINYKEYAKLASCFYPVGFNAAEWVSAAKNAGMKYITITARHHDGFSMWHTAQSDYNIVDATPYKRDIIKELSEECRKQGIKFGFYYSHLDWFHPDYRPSANSGYGTGRETQGDWNRYLNFMDNQLTELLTDYGPVNVIWFDGWWDHKYDIDWRLEEQYALIHKLQPACLIGNNHHVKPFDGEDFQMFERDLPGQNFAGLSPDSEIGQLPLETCQTMNDSWGYKITDLNYKDAGQLIHYLIKAAGNNANLLLNVGPQPNGEMPSQALKIMEEIGSWLKVYGETIYGTRGGMISQRDWGVTTQKDNKMYVHILNLKDQCLFLPITDRKVRKATLFKNNERVRFTQNTDGVLISLPEIPTDIDYVVVLEF